MNRIDNQIIAKWKFEWQPENKKKSEDEFVDFMRIHITNFCRNSPNC